jgi:hypothetical protein
MVHIGYASHVSTRKVLPTTRSISSETAHSDPADFSRIGYIDSFQSNRVRRVEVIVKLLRHILNHFQGLHALPCLTEQRRKHSDAAFAGAMATIPRPTPLFARRPTCQSYPPEPS